MTKIGSLLRVPAAAVLGAFAVAGLGLSRIAAGDAPAGDRPGAPRPTILLVHGAFADASGWDGVIGRLQGSGYPVLAVANPLRGIAADSAYLRSVVDTVPGPVVLVGHSYGGAVISNAANGAANVTALVFVAAFAPDEGEILGAFSDPTTYPGAALTPDALVIRPFDGGADASIDPARFREIFAADLPESDTARMAVRQRPVAVASLEEPAVAPAWRDLPSWYVVFSRDKALSPVAERFFAERMNATTVEIDASHAGFISHADRTAAVIESAATATH